MAKDDRKSDRRRGGCLGCIIKTILSIILIFYAAYGVFAYHAPETLPGINRGLGGIRDFITQTYDRIVNRNDRGARTASDEEGGEVSAAVEQEATAVSTAKPTKTPAATATPKPAAAAEPTSDDFTPLQRGSKGEDVKALQKRLIELNYLTGSADGSFGKGTETAVCDFQKAAGLPITGVVDRATHTLLFSDDAPAATPAPTATPKPSGIRKEVREFVDGYEQFFNEYIEFMKSADQTSVVWLTRYSTMMIDYASWVDKAEKLDESDWTNEEVQYWAQAQARITAKLYQAGLSM